MQLFNKLLGAKNNEPGLVTRSTDSLIPSKPLYVHPDIKELLWIADGPKRNYAQKPTQTDFEINGIRFSIEFGLGAEPSLISIKNPISIVNDVSNVERPPYFPTYSQLTPLQRGVYWKLLENPYNTAIDIGFVFILYYGLERHLLEGNFEKAFQVILKLRDIRPNKSFQNYSACALILTSLARKRADLAALFLQSLDKKHELNFPDNMFLICKYGLDLPLMPKDIMRMAKTFEFNNMNYIKQYPGIFEVHLRKTMLEKTGNDTLDIKQYITIAEWKKLKKQSVSMYANTSIQNKTIEIPTLSDCFKLKRIIYNMLEYAHEETKKELSTMRKNGVPPIAQTITPSTDKKMLIFDMKQEKQLLNELNKNKQRITEKHFSYIALQDFYYKYRTLGEEYLEKCIHYCKEDIEVLPILQREYRIEEERRILRMISIYGKKEAENRLRNIEPFIGNIPAFFRLAVIYENRKDIASAINICTDAINYYKNNGMITAAQKFEKRKEKLKGKL